MNILSLGAFSVAATGLVLAACSNMPSTAQLGSACSTLAGKSIPASSIGLPSGPATVASAVLVPAAPQSVSSNTLTPATPDYCKVLGSLAPRDGTAQLINFQVNLPTQWNGKALQYGGGGYNGVLVTGLAPLRDAAPGDPLPITRGYVTVGTDSGHQTAPDQPPQAFALNDEALLNFAHASYKKVRDVAVALTRRAYGRAPDKLYFVGSSEGGREGLTMAQRYPANFDGIFSRVPVINWTGLQHAGTRNGLATVGDGWLRPAQVKLVHDAVLAACDVADGLADGVVSNPAGCQQSFDIAALRCAAGEGAGAGAGADGCLNDAQVRAVQTLRSLYRFDFALANGVTEYPGWGISGEGAPAFGPTGGWSAWWLGSSAPTQPPQPTNGIAWFYGSGAIQYFYARDPVYDLTRYRPADHVDRIRAVSALMDSTNPDLSAFEARGGKLLMLENMADYAQSPYAGIAYHQSVVDRMGAARVAGFMRLYIAPGVDHVGAGAPANVDMLSALTDWVERGRPPVGLQLVEQSFNPPFAVTRARPLCEWPAWTHYRGGDPAQAASFECIR